MFLIFRDGPRSYYVIGNLLDIVCGLQKYFSFVYRIRIPYTV